MHIKIFDITNGIYKFIINELTTKTHAHPAIEIIISQKGTFSIKSSHKKFMNLRAVVIAPNIPHEFHGSNTVCEFTFLEPSHFDWHKYMHLLQSSSNGILVLEPLNINSLETTTDSPKTPFPIDERIMESINRISCIKSNLFPTTDELASIACISSSRFSHLFKKEIGISVSKYIIWTRLKNTIHSYLGTCKK